VSFPDGYIIPHIVRYVNREMTILGRNYANMGIKESRKGADGGKDFAGNAFITHKTRPDHRGAGMPSAAAGLCAHSHNRCQ